MQNGSVTKDLSWRSGGQLDSAIRQLYQQTVQGSGVRTVAERTNSPQIGYNGSRSIVSSLSHTPPKQETNFATARWLIHQPLHHGEWAPSPRPQYSRHRSVCKVQANPVVRDESSNKTHSKVCE